MTYIIYKSSKSASLYVVVKDADGRAKAEKAHPDFLGQLSEWKRVESLGSLIGMAPAATVDAEITKDGFHLQRTEIQMTESVQKGRVP